jgi:hypothetical protein
MLLLKINRYRKEFALLLISIMLTEHYVLAKTMLMGNGKFSYHLPYTKYSGERESISFDQPFSRGKAERMNTAKSNSIIRKSKTNVKQHSPFIGGPGQPEMETFQATGVSNMVDLFSGDFSYNIPLMDVGGYPVNIHYNSGIGMDQDASWVGLGWNINPGTINRNMRGLPDDFNGKDSVTKTLNIKPNVTIGFTFDFNPEIVGKEIKINGKLNDGTTLFKPNLTISHNNYTGLGLDIGASPTLGSGKPTQGKMTSTFDLGSYSISSKDGISLHPSFSIVTEKTEEAIRYESNTAIGLGFNSRRGMTDLTVKGTAKKTTFSQEKMIPPSSYGSGGGYALSFGKTSFIPSIQMPFTSYQVSVRLKTGAEFFGLHPLGAVGGFYSRQYLAERDKVRKLPAYGFLHYQDANDQQEVLLDYNRESDNTYTKNIPHIAIPVYTHDLFSVSGEGVGGMFRPYRGDIGYIRDPRMKTKNISYSETVDVGAGNAAHVGVDLTFNYSYTETHEWIKKNSLRGTLRFRHVDTTFEPVYFRNPVEKTVNARDYYNAVGGDDLVRVDLGSGLINPQATNNFTRFNEKKESNGSSTITSNTVKTTRDKRAQVFTYLNAGDASLVGLDSMIAIYPENKFITGKCDTIQCIGNSCDTVRILKEPRVNDYRKTHHISEVTILNPDGKRYIYGIPAYNTKQTEVTFAVDKSNSDLATGQADYTPATDDSTANNKGKDHFYSKEELPPYAHSYLLTGLVSADYVDVKGDGISDDDIGDAVKFKYSRVYSKNNPYKWRTPFEQNKAGYNEGLRTDKSDDKGNYVYGEKEIWYLNSIESKTMMATFTINTISDPRLDGRGVNDKSGGRDDIQKLRYLKRIDLYTKADFIKNGTNAKPVKSVHFGYSYKLCKGNPGSITATTGKLTLDSIWFTYNGNNKGKKNPYLFYYHTNNPDYNARSVDRWGNYKNAVNNPGSMLNSEFPYALQDSTIAASNAAAWTLQSIKLPSGGKIVVDYESDDYGFVQNRRAAQMFRIAGFSNSANTAWTGISNQLYQNAFADNVYMYVELPQNVTSKTEFYHKYLNGLEKNKLYFRAAVQMPADSYGNGYENIPGYAEWDDYDLVGTGATNKVWIKLKQVKGSNPIAKAALQYLRLNLPSKAYPGSDVKNDAGPRAVVKVLGSFASNLFQMMATFDGSSKLRGWCKQFDANKSIVRLANPTYKKYGGGLRVKRVLIYDNWNAMSGQKESFYGQEYNYTTTEQINGVATTISSGVANYEPTIGNDENPFHVALEYKDRASILAPLYGRYIDNPVGESFFPSPSVGYSKVRVSSVKRKNLKSANGFEETEFFTARDFPIYSDFTPFDRKSKKQFRSPLRFFLKVDLRHHLTMSQGFRVELNDMHGKVKSQVTYAENDTTHAISETKNYYRATGINTSKPKLSNKVSVVETTTGLVNTDAEIGKDVEVMVDMREQQSETWGVNVEINNDFFVIPTPIPIPTNLPSFIPVPNHDLKRFRSVTVMKIITRYGILDSVEHSEKGSKVSVKNLLYDAETGEVVLSRTQNEFNDPVYSFSYPAYQAYDALGLAYKNINAVFHNIIITNGKLNNTYYEKFFTGGDEVMLRTNEVNTKCDNSSNYFTPKKTLKLWAIEGPKIGKPNGIYFIDRTGKLFTGNQTDMKIIRSGRRNLLGDAGSVVSLANPIVPFGQGYKLQFDNATNVINASAAEYKESWKVEDRFGTADSITATISTPEVATAYFSPNDCFVMQLANNDDIRFAASGVTRFETRYKADRNCGICGWYSNSVKSWLKFNLPDSLANKQIIEAKLYLNPDVGDHSGSHGVNEAHRNGKPSNDFDNYSSIARYTGPWINTGMSDNSLKYYFNGGNLDVANQANLVATTPGNGAVSNISDEADVTNMVTTMLQQKATVPDQVFQIRITSTGLQDRNDWNRRCYTSDLNGIDPETNNPCGINHGVTTCITHLKIKYLTCNTASGNIIFMNNGPNGPGYYCYRQDTIRFCRSLLTQTSSNPYVMGYLGNWRPYRSYTYFDDRKETSASVATNIRTDGAFKTFAPFWSYGANGLTAIYDSTKWVWNSEITKINRRGMEIENKDPLGRYNAGLYGYNSTLPVAVAQNSQYKEIAYDGFEDYDFINDKCAKPCSTFNHLNFTVNPATNFSTQQKHSGKYSLQVTAGSNLGIVTAVPLIRTLWDTIATQITNTIDTNKIIVNANQTDKYCYNAVHTDSSSLLPRYSPVPGSKIVVGAWVKEAKDCKCESYTENSLQVTFNQVNGSSVTYILKPNGNIIEGWQRIDSVILVPAATVSYSVKFYASANSTTYFDDFRLQPFNSNMKTFVYNPMNLRLMAELDENNYATFYEYDDEGTLVRVKKETERGIKTIKETRSALLKQAP